MEKLVADSENVRLDAYISSKETNLSRTNVQRLIEEGNILVNGQKKKISYKVQIGDNIEINIPEAKETSIKAENIPVEVQRYNCCK